MTINITLKPAKSFRLKPIGIAMLGLMSTVIAAPAIAVEGNSPAKGVFQLDHIFVVMMENHGFDQIMDNPNAPYINKLANTANLATNYFGVGHPSLTNYLEVVGGSNFGIQNDHNTDWHNTTCIADIKIGTVNNEATAGSICPISGIGSDAETPAVDTTNLTSGQPGLNNIDGILSIPAADNISGKTIADQLVEHGKSWKSYQESIPFTGVDRVNYSDGVYSNLTDFSTITPVLTPALNSADIVSLYASKHNPFAYFQNIQEGNNPNLSLKNTEGFDALYADLATGEVPTFSFIAPNQCNDQHGRGNAGPFCNYDPIPDGSQAGVNPALIKAGDVAVERIVTAIHNSPAWKEGNNAIVVLWDENDFSTAPNINQVALIVDTSYGYQGMISGNYYNHFSLLKSFEAALGLPCLNHACDYDVSVMADLFGKPVHRRHHESEHRRHHESEHRRHHESERDRH